MSEEITKAATHAIAKLEGVQDKLDFYGRVDSVAATLLLCIEEVRAGTLKPAQGNSIALLCSTLIKALEAARGSTPAVSITAQLNREEIEEILHGRDPFKPTTITVETGAARGAGSGAVDPLAQDGSAT
jgi:hypothetical protein